MTEMNSLLKDLLHALGAAASVCVLNADDEGDQVVFGSTNDFEMLKEAAKAYDDYRFRTGDYGDEADFSEDDEDEEAVFRSLSIQATALDTLTEGGEEE